MKQVGKVVKKAVSLSLAIIIFLLLWELCGRNGWLVNPLFLPPFSKVVQTLGDLVANGDVLRHASISLRRAVTGFCGGLVFAIPMGLALGWNKRLETFLNPLLQMFRNLPILALFPVFVMFFGIGELSKGVIIFWAVIWPTLLSTIAGVKSVDPQLIKAARSMGTSSLRLFVTVVLPAALPYIFTGVRLSAANSILVLVAAEMIGASRGLGYALYFYQMNMMVPQMYAYLVIMAIIGVSLNGILELVEKRSFSWRSDNKVKS
jgi:NitT/TauT family transport system permease protein